MHRSRNTAVRGIRVGSEADTPGLPKFTANQTLGVPMYTEALGMLNKERQRLDYRSPCESNPSLWDGIDREDGVPSLRREAERIGTAIKLCHACKVFGDCEYVQLAATDTPDLVVTGTLAGTFFDTTESGKHVNQFLSTGYWPEGVDPDS